MWTPPLSFVEPHAAAHAVRVRGVEKSFVDGEARVVVLPGVDLDALAGEITFIVGPSGCGKTTLLSIIAGILRADAGEVEVFGTRIGALNPMGLAQFRARNVGFIFQQFNLLPALTAVENAAIPVIIGGAAAAAAERKAAKLLDRLGLGAHLDKLPAQLSGGQQQRVAIARALIHSPRLLVCDEPTASLDGATGAAAMTLLRELALSPERAALIVTHDERIHPYADRIVHMCDGRIQHPEIATRS